MKKFEVILFMKAKTDIQQSVSKGLYCPSAFVFGPVLC